MKISQLNNKVLYVNCSYKTKRFDIFLCQKIESNLNKKLNKYGYQIGGAGTILSTFERGFTIYDVNKSDYKNIERIINYAMKKSDIKKFKINTKEAHDG